jgi:hypothetical protein
MRSDVVVVRSPGIDCRTRILKASEPVEVKAVRFELAVEALDERILSWLAWLDEVQLDAGALRPKEHRFAGELRSVVANDRLGQRPCELIERSSQPLA